MKEVKKKLDDAKNLTCFNFYASTFDARATNKDHWHATLHAASKKTKGFFIPFEAPTLGLAAAAYSGAYTYFHIHTYLCFKEVIDFTKPFQVNIEPRFTEKDKIMDLKWTPSPERLRNRRKRY